ncbi:C-terminal motor kinesin [Trypanosoma theileri]|uniref:Kinesin-like protein n=1 Tax=Trypanosoma theileri TaxID=67003 RepID=A0A1X0P6D6_9TRYP|nr:C-terminal motor kinesin [Trypanosoma theileri]ORC92506.1 C-terminal motor kinesin [Trypanosoma theileri]
MSAAPSSFEQARNRVEVTLRSLYASTNVEEERETIMTLVNLVRQGNANIILDNLKEHLKRGPPSEQERSMTILDQLMLNCGPQFAVLLSSEKWTERFFKVAKLSTNDTVVRKIMATIILWYKRYRTSRFERCLQRFAQSKALGDTFNQVQQQVELELRASTRNRRRSGDAAPQTADTREDNHQALNQMETFLLEAQGDLASLEYALEHPHILHDDDIAKECKRHKFQCMRLLESGEHEDIAPELMQLIERFSEALELYEAMTGLDMGEGEAARLRAVSGDGTNPAEDSDDEEHNRRLRERVAPRQNVEQVMLQAQEATQQLVEKERLEMIQLRADHEQLRQKYEELQNKYKDAKSKNKDAVRTLESYVLRFEELQSQMGAGGDPALAGAGASGAAAAAAQLSKLNFKDPMMNSAISPEEAMTMRDNVQAIRRSLREIREQYVSDIKRESAYYSSQLTSAIASIVAAAQQERQAEHKALLWTQELYKKELKLRKQYYNTIQELKGNIRVYCRVRPMLQTELKDGHKNVMQFPSTDELKLVDQNGRPKLYEFDEVYPPEAPQSKVFEDTSPLIDSVVDGYNVCIFAYGQTGSGKTYTMGGGDGETKGINTRALERLFEVIEERKETETSTVTISVLEIYCENIRDLLHNDSKLSYEVKQGGPCGTYVTNLSEVPVKSPGDIYKIMERANRNRSEGQTNMNEHSSRSHMILYIIVRTTNKQTGMQSYGKLSLVDLAGSERLEKSGAEGQQLKEAVSINKSLSALGDVISGLSQNGKHIPFRNSILTFLLQDSMAGQAKVLMFACVSPASYNVSESNSSLQFASRARGVAFGQIKKNPAVAAA